ncbi:MAG TPA: acetolactate synthase large subunit [Rhizomicrobium sp.]|nr:acetolactate synthase large subunit [Rhizomicrobium sp.]
MNGAESLLRTLVACGVDHCFMNPGTSEIHLVEALDREPRMKAVPVLFEGVATGAADGYARMTGRPACTLFHLGPGLSNALANLHNACRAEVPMVNLVGDHATFHRPLDPPLAADIEAIAKPFSRWLASARHTEQLGYDGATAVAAARTAPGRIATLVVPADIAWSDGGRIAEPEAPPAPPLPDAARIEEAAQLLKNGARTALVLGAHTTEGAGLEAAARIAAKTGARLLAPFTFARMERGGGRPVVERIAYITDQALAQLAEFRQMILVGAPPPVSFFGSPTRPSTLTPKDCTIMSLASRDEDCAGALDQLAAALGAQNVEPDLQKREPPRAPSGASLLDGIPAAVASLLPENAIVVDESITSGRGLMAATQSAAPHDWLVNTGGSIGIGTPLAVGAAMAAPGRPVLCFEGDGSFMYTLQALWTAAREDLPITTVIFANRNYAILKYELMSLGGNPGPRALSALDIAPPDIDFIALSKSLGVPACRVTTAEEFSTALSGGFESKGPNVIEVPL